MLFDITVFPPTCQANGYSVYVSRETGGINIRDEVPRLPHDYGEWSIDMETGALSRVCAMCGEEDYHSADGLPRILLFGDAEALTESGSATLEARFIRPWRDNAFTGWARIDWPGYSEENRIKRDLSVAFYDDETLAQPHDFELFKGVARNAYPLAANTIDLTQCRHLTCAQLWNRLSGTGDAPESMPVTVYLNGDFKGLYSMQLPLEAALYGMEADGPQAAITPANPYSFVSPFLDSADFDAEWRVLFCGSEDDQWLRDSLRELVDFVHDSDDETFHEQLRAYLDTDSAIDYLLFMYAMGLSQSTSKDIALLKDGYDPWTLAPFDMSDAFNLDYDGNAMPVEVFLPTRDADGRWDSGTRSPLWDRLLNVFAPEIRLRWRELRETVLVGDDIARQVRFNLWFVPERVMRSDRAQYHRSFYLTNPARQMQQFIGPRLMLLDSLFGTDGE